MSADIHCPRCNTGKFKTERIPLGGGRYHLKAVCAVCGRFINFLPHQKTKFPFGKHRGLSVIEVAAKDPGYLQWCLSNDILRECRLKDAVEYEVLTA